jgi:tetratricopeptide (TPR) repeat protein
MAKKRKRKKRRTYRPGWSASTRQVDAWLDELEGQMVDRIYEDAVETARRVLRHVPEGSRPYGLANYFLGTALAMLQDFDEAYEALTEALAVDPNDASAWYNRGIALRSLLRTGEALRDVEQALAIEKDPELCSVYEEEQTFLSDIVEEQVAMRGPTCTMDQLIEEQRTFWQGMQLMGKEQWAEAAFRHVIAMSNVLPQPWGNLGGCLIMQERYDEAEEALQKALEIDPDYAVARRNLKELPNMRENGVDGMTIGHPIAGRRGEQNLIFIED